MHGSITVRIAGENRFRGKEKIKNVVRKMRGSAREGHQVHRPIPDTLLPLQPVNPSGAVYQ
jgi:hypothetical protein